MYDTEMLEAILGAAVGVIVVLAIVFLAWAVFYIVGLWKLFKKAGKAGWESIVPFYNNWVMVEIVGLQWWWFLIVLTPTILSVLGLDSLSFLGQIAGLIANINIYYNLSKKFNKTTGWVVLSVFFGWITIPLLGYSKNEVWNAGAPVTPNGLFDANRSSATTNASVTPEAQQSFESTNEVNSNNDVNNNQ